ncbi:hypothetical protein OPV22_020199 [Ensete ventricosum]|uniref:Uncharacterized protein n=2 Tax=Ensete ventricosum TaxID=4639 RepID=A0A445MMB7_ENSVE|nr:hypothetical protein OPV22_020199 [Ensete ventricosum]RWV78482.1 hypothetical protein GW17_00060548 [Ensete ventricosum]RWW43339.1 hypothetical protein BHE74_00051016 [Ensete ventricosum]RZR75378.1 hypothetical protein BHM03_00056056 [Ensete ventricosum]
MVGEAAAADKPSGPPASGDFVIRHWRRFRPATSPVALDVGGASPGDFERGQRTGYTSLRDLIGSPPLPSGPLSPDTPCGGDGGGEIRIKNRLVKQAAYAYLQPTPSARGSDRHHRRRFFRSLRHALAFLTFGIAVEPLGSCIEFLRRLFRRPRR